MQCGFCPGKAAMGKTGPVLIAFVIFLAIGSVFTYSHITQPSISKTDIQAVRMSMKKANSFGLGLLNDIGQNEVNNKSTISITEFQKVLQETDHFSDQEMEELMLQIDVDGTGDISREEIEIFLGQTVEMEVYITSCLLDHLYSKLSSGCNRGTKGTYYGCSISSKYDGIRDSSR